jgi:hypothetical protein
MQVITRFIRIADKNSVMLMMLLFELVIGMLK